MAQRQTAIAGFSLIEVMIVLVIIGILMMIAVPSYQDSVRKSRRADGMRDLMELASRQERFYAQNSQYTNIIKTATGLNFKPNDDDNGDPDEPTLSSEGHYTLSVTPCETPDEANGADFSTCYNLSAAPRGTQAEDACGILTVNSLGQRSHSGSPANDDLDCW